MARRERPAGAEIREKAKTAKFDHQRAIKRKKYKKSAEFVPANLDHLESLLQLEQGVVIGSLETEVADEALAPGKYNLFLVGHETGWKVYAERDGEVVAEAGAVRVEMHPEGSRDLDECYLAMESPIAVMTVLAVAGLVFTVASFFGDVFHWW